MKTSVSVFGNFKIIKILWTTADPTGDSFWYPTDDTTVQKKETTTRLSLYTLKRRMPRALAHLALLGRKNFTRTLSMICQVDQLPAQSPKTPVVNKTHRVK